MGVSGQALPRGRGNEKADEAAPQPWSRSLALLGGCVAVCLINPSLWRVYPAAIQPLLPPYNFSPLIPKFGAAVSASLTRGLALVYVATMGLGLASFALNRPRFNLGRFLMFVLAALLWGLSLFERDVFAMVFAMTLALNGQEWFHDRFGTEGKLGRGWAFWSVSGRAVTLVLIFLAVGMRPDRLGQTTGRSDLRLRLQPRRLRLRDGRLSPQRTHRR